MRSGVVSGVSMSRMTPDSRALGTLVQPLTPQCDVSPNHKDSKGRSRR